MSILGRPDLVSTDVTVCGAGQLHTFPVDTRLDDIWRALADPHYLVSHLQQVSFSITKEDDGRYRVQVVRNGILDGPIEGATMRELGVVDGLVFHAVSDEVTPTHSNCVFTQQCLLCVYVCPHLAGGPGDGGSGGSGGSGAPADALMLPFATTGDVATKLAYPRDAKWLLIRNKHDGRLHCANITVLQSFAGVAQGTLGMACSDKTCVGGLCERLGGDTWPTDVARHALPTLLKNDAAAATFTLTRQGRLQLRHGTLAPPPFDLRGEIDADDAYAMIQDLTLPLPSAEGAGAGGACSPVALQRTVYVLWTSSEDNFVLAGEYHAYARYEYASACKVRAPAHGGGEWKECSGGLFFPLAALHKLRGRFVGGVLRLTLEDPTQVPFPPSISQLPLFGGRGGGGKASGGGAPVSAPPMARQCQCVADDGAEGESICLAPLLQSKYLTYAALQQVLGNRMATVRDSKTTYVMLCILVEGTAYRIKILKTKFLVTRVDSDGSVHDMKYDTAIDVREQLGLSQPGIVVFFCSTKNRSGPIKGNNRDKSHSLSFRTGVVLGGGGGGSSSSSREDRKMPAAAAAAAAAASSRATGGGDAGGNVTPKEDAPGTIPGSVRLLHRLTENVADLRAKAIEAIVNDRQALSILRQGGVAIQDEAGLLARIGECNQVMRDLKQDSSGYTLPQHWRLFLVAWLWRMLPPTGRAVAAVREYREGAGGGAGGVPLHDAFTHETLVAGLDEAKDLTKREVLFVLLGGVPIVGALLRLGGGGGATWDSPVQAFEQYLEPMLARLGLSKISLLSMTRSGTAHARGPNHQLLRLWTVFLGVLNQTEGWEALVCSLKVPSTLRPGEGGHTALRGIQTQLDLYVRPLMQHFWPQEWGSAKLAMNTARAAADTATRFEHGVVFFGMTGSGKTTLQNTLHHLVGDHPRVPPGLAPAPAPVPPTEAEAAAAAAFKAILPRFSSGAPTNFATIQADIAARATDTADALARTLAGVLPLLGGPHDRDDLLTPQRVREMATLPQGNVANSTTRTTMLAAPTEPVGTVVVHMRSPHEIEALGSFAELPPEKQDALRTVAGRTVRLALFEPTADDPHRDRLQLRYWLEFFNDVASDDQPHRFTYPQAIRMIGIGGLKDLRVLDHPGFEGFNKECAPDPEVCHLARQVVAVVKHADHLADTGMELYHQLPRLRKLVDALAACVQAERPCPRPHDGGFAVKILVNVPDAPEAGGGLAQIQRHRAARDRQIAQGEWLPRLVRAVRQEAAGLPKYAGGDVDEQQWTQVEAALLPFFEMHAVLPTSLLLVAHLLKDDAGVQADRLLAIARALPFTNARQLLQTLVVDLPSHTAAGLAALQRQAERALQGLGDVAASCPPPTFQDRAATRATLAKIKETRVREACAKATRDDMDAACATLQNALRADPEFVAGVVAHLQQKIPAQFRSRHHALSRDDVVRALCGQVPTSESPKTRTVLTDMARTMHRHLTEGLAEHAHQEGLSGVFDRLRAMTDKAIAETQAMVDRDLSNDHDKALARTYIQQAIGIIVPELIEVACGVADADDDADDDAAVADADQQQQDRVRRHATQLLALVLPAAQATVLGDTSVKRLGVVDTDFLRDVVHKFLGLVAKKAADVLRTIHDNVAQTAGNTLRGLRETGSRPSAKAAEGIRNGLAAIVQDIHTAAARTLAEKAPYLHLDRAWILQDERVQALVANVLLCRIQGLDEPDLALLSAPRTIHHDRHDRPHHHAAAAAPAAAAAANGDDDALARLRSMLLGTAAATTCTIEGREGVQVTIAAGANLSLRVLAALMGHGRNDGDDAAAAATIEAACRAKACMLAALVPVRNETAFKTLLGIPPDQEIVEAFAEGDFDPVKALVLVCHAAGVSLQTDDGRVVCSGGVQTQRTFRLSCATEADDEGPKRKRSRR